MKLIFAIPLLTALLASPVYAQQEEGPSLMERGAQLFFDGLKQEMGPALQELSDLMEDAGPALQSFVAEMGPKLRDVLDRVEDWSVYEAPEVMPNGDIIIRRKPDAPELPDTAQPAPEGQIDL